MNNLDVRLTPRSLVLLRRLDQMAPTTRRELTQWLWDHGITPTAVALGLQIERDDTLGCVIWREREVDGAVTKRWRFAVSKDGGPWPSAFPAALLAAATATADELSHAQ